MKTIIQILVIILLIITCAITGIFGYYLIKNDFSFKDEEIKVEQYKVYINETLIDTYSSLKDAINKSKEHENSKVIKENKVVWKYEKKISENSLNGYTVIDGEKNKIQFNNYNSAINHFKKLKSAYLYYSNDVLLYSTNFTKKQSHKIEVPMYYQKPQLPRGCEVTSLSMLLNYHKIYVDKMELAKNIEKDETPYEVLNGQIYSGNPNVGFVGNMYNINEHGYGVYMLPIFNLTKKYTNSAMNLTGTDLENLLYLVDRNRPVVIITNTSYKKLPQNNFVKWNTSQGEIFITYKEHSIIITGYDEKYIYFNDPLGYENKALKNDFEEAYIQMGKQAIALAK